MWLFLTNRSPLLSDKFRLAKVPERCFLPTSSSSWVLASGMIGIVDRAEEIFLVSSSLIGLAGSSHGPWLGNSFTWRFIFRSPERRMPRCQTIAFVRVDFFNYRLGMNIVSLKNLLFWFSRSYEKCLMRVWMKYGWTLIMWVHYKPRSGLLLQHLLQTSL